MRHLRGRRALTAVATIVLLLALVMAPLLIVLGAGANEALRVTAFRAAGLDDAIFWGTAMTFLSIIPGVGGCCARGWSDRTSRCTSC